VPNQLRGQVSALLIFTINVVGLTMGPWLVGILNDIWGQRMVGYSLAVTVGMASLISAILFRATYAPYRLHYSMIHGERS
jgi:MFS family permease